MTKSELKRKLMTQRIEALINTDRKEQEGIPLIEQVRRMMREGVLSYEDIFTTELLKQDDVKLH